MLPPEGGERFSPRYLSLVFASQQFYCVCLGPTNLVNKTSSLKRLISLICNNPGFAQLRCKFSVKNLLKTHHDKRRVKHFNSDCDLYAVSAVRG